MCWDVLKFRFIFLILQKYCIFELLGKDSLQEQFLVLFVINLDIQLLGGSLFVKLFKKLFMGILGVL